jgi:predicted DsbA family dithiol-disulfide isomerase
MEELFKGYFEQGKSPNDLDMLLDAATAAGFERNNVAAYLKKGETRERIIQEARDASLRGIHGVPHFVFNDK